MVVKRVNEDNETLGLVPLVHVEQRDMVDEDRIETIGDSQEVGSPERLLAEI
ncbi:hypothetical protein D3C78_930550 [compost metagenome]